MLLKEPLQRGRVESVFAGELCFLCRSPSNSRLFSSLCPAGLTGETTCCSSDPRSHSLEEISKQNHVNAEQRRDTKGSESEREINTVPHSG